MWTKGTKVFIDVDKRHKAILPMWTKGTKQKRLKDNFKAFCRIT